MNVVKIFFSQHTTGCDLCESDQKMQTNKNCERKFSCGTTHAYDAIACVSERELLCRNINLWCRVCERVRESKIYVRISA